MSLEAVTCCWCGSDFPKDTRYINENKRLGHKFYCSIYCQSRFKNKQKELICGNCEATFKKKLSQVYLHNFCSRSCAATLNNSKYPKRTSIQRRCGYCNECSKKKSRYCSQVCKSKALSMSGDQIIQQLKEFYSNSGRIPLKREFKHAKAARSRFGSWNKAIEASGFNPNQALFTKKQIANDGHICDSLAEKIIDDWLYARKISHRIHVKYPDSKYTSDFVVNGVIIEFFGLSGELKRYDELMKDKLQMIQDRNLKRISIYPKDIVPVSQLDKVLRIVLKE